MRKSIIGHEHHPIRRLLASRMAFPVGTMLNDLMTAFLVAFAAVTAPGLLSRIWEYF